MRIAFIGVFMLLCFPRVAFGVSFVEQDSSYDIDTWRDIAADETYFGELSTFPHTFEFLVAEPLELSLTLGARAQDQLPSLILVKERARGVEEVLRLAPGDASAPLRERAYGMTFTTYEPIHVELSEGIYRLEVSTPDNMTTYRLTLGEGSGTRSYFGRVADTFKVHSFYGSWITALFTAPIFIPLVLIGGLLFVLRYRRLWQNSSSLSQPQPPSSTSPS